MLMYLHPNLNGASNCARQFTVIAAGTAGRHEAGHARQWSDQRV